MDETPKTSAPTGGGRVRITVNVEKCVGHARCAAVAGAVYELNDEGYNVTREKFVGLELEALAKRGAKACPEGVITVEIVSD